MLDHYDRPTWPFHTTISNSRIEKRDKNHQTTPTYKEEERFLFEAGNKRKDALDHYDRPTWPNLVGVKEWWKKRNKKK